jgi:hypothetical protein
MMTSKIAVLFALASMSTAARAEDAAAAAAHKTMHEAMQDQADMPMHTAKMPAGPMSSSDADHVRHTNAGKSGAPADASKHKADPGRMGRMDAGHAAAANKAAMGAAMGGGPNGGAAGPRGPGMMGNSNGGGGMMGGTSGQMNPSMMQQQTNMHPGGMMGGTSGGGMLGGTPSGGGMMPGTNGGTSPGGTMPSTTPGGTTGTGPMMGGGTTGTTPASPKMPAH